MFGNREKRLARRQFKDFVRWFADLTKERRDYLMSLCYRESQVRDLVTFFAALSAEQQYDSLLRLGLTTEQAEQAIAKGEFIGVDRRLGDGAAEHAGFQQLEISGNGNLDLPPELMEPPRQLKKRIEMRSSVDLS